MKLAITETIELPEQVTATLDGGLLTIKGPNGEISRRLNDPYVTLKTEGSTITLSNKNATKREKRMINTYRAHINNLIRGVQEPYQYKLKICSGHFPMNVSISDNTLSVKNFLGEKSPRSARLKQGADVKIEGDLITVTSPDKELAGNVASDIELLTKKSGKDLRVFQDGIYIIEKAGVPVE